MVICIECSQKDKQKMDSIMGGGEYSGYSELISIAIENLWLLQRKVAKQGVLIVDEGGAPPTTAPVFSQGRRSVIRNEEPIPDVPASMHIPDLFRSEELDELTPATAKVPPAKDAERVFTIDRWIFGQFNRLLPAKANCRALLRLTAGQEDGVSLEDVTARIAEAATSLGDYLADHDRRHQIKRDNVLATAFPRSGPDAGKSRDRYVNQFVGSMNSRNVLSGLLWDYRLVGLVSGKDSRLLPTEQAIQLARLINPVLDQCQTDPAQKFSPKETAFLLGHIRSSIPVEAFAFQTLIQAILNGADTPDKLQEALRDLTPADSNRSLSPSFLTSQRSGALSRMADLGLVVRIRKGVKVSYAITQGGKVFIANNSNTTDTEKEND